MGAHLRSIAPAGVCVVEAAAADERAVVHPAERSAVAASAATRRIEFATARRCAREALDDLAGRPRGAGPLVAIPVGADRAPRWPSGVVGSITHTRAYFAAAVAGADRFVGLGIDVERNAELEPGVVANTSHPAELAALRPAAGVSGPALLFSIRESLFKAWFPPTGAWLDFHDVVLDLDVEHGSFVASVDPSVHPDAATADLRGRFTWTGDLVLTMAWWPRRPRP